MQRYTILNVREKFLTFMEQKGHSILPSSPLVPENDRTTLFVGSGMQPLITYLSQGIPHPSGTRLANAQRCFRAEDIEEIGDERHTTFFEMLGNWSLGDYFKKDAIGLFFEFLTSKEGLEIDTKHLAISVFGGDTEVGIERDEECIKYWGDLFQEKGVSYEIVDMTETKGVVPPLRTKGDVIRIFVYGTKENWWSRAGAPNTMPIGEIGGPDTEVFFDYGEEYKGTHPNDEGDRYMEIGNIVFMTYKKTRENEFTPLSRKNVDFGGGLERLTAAANTIHDVFTLSVFDPARILLEKNGGVSYKDTPHTIRVVLDHARASLFLAADGIVPSNTLAGYVLRRLIRFGTYQASHLNTSFVDVVLSFVDEYGKTMPHIKKNKEMIRSIIQDESKKFEGALNRAKKQFLSLTTKMKETNTTVLRGEDAFNLQSTHGLLLEVLRDLAHQNGVSIDMDGYEKEMKKHKTLSRKTLGQFKGGLSGHSDKEVKYHTATHLLHQALRTVLGNHVEQRGSNITPERLRFDFSHPKKMSVEEKEKVEELINTQIKRDMPVTKKEATVSAAKNEGALGVFDDRYGETVSLYTIGDFSKEICGGPHVSSTGTLGVFKIKKEESVAEGVRRIKAVLL